MDLLAIQNLSGLCRSHPLCLGASRCPQFASYDTLMSPPLISCGVAFGSALGCGATGVRTIRMPNVSLDLYVFSNTLIKDILNLVSSSLPVVWFLPMVNRKTAGNLKVAKALNRAAWVFCSGSRLRKMR